MMTIAMLMFLPLRNENRNCCLVRPESWAIPEEIKDSATMNGMIEQHKDRLMAGFFSKVICFHPKKNNLKTVQM